MLFRKKLTVIVGFIGMIIQLSPAHAELVSIDKALYTTGQTLPFQAEERTDVQQQLIKLGVDPTSARSRVKQMTNAEISEINSHLNELPAGAGITKVDVLVITIMILLL